MLRNHRPYQWMMSRTGCRTLSAAVALAAKGAGMAGYVLKTALRHPQAALQGNPWTALEAYLPRPEGPSLPLPPLRKTRVGLALSVIVPVHNGETTIAACLDSILMQQTKYRMEVIVIQDSSTDGTASVLNMYAARVRLLSIRGGSAAAARNAGLAVAQGAYVMFVDSDDRLASGAVEAMLDAAQNQHADIVQGAWQYMTLDGTLGAVQRYVPMAYTGAHACDRFDLPGMPWGKVYRRTLFAQVRFPEGFTAFEDSIIHFLIFRQAARIVAISPVVYCWRRNPAGITATTQHQTAALQSCWLMAELLRQDARLHLPHDALYSRTLLMQLSNFCYANLAQLPEAAQQTAFRCCCALYRANAPEETSPRLPFAVACAKKALATEDFRRWAAQGKYFLLIG